MKTTKRFPTGLWQFLVLSFLLGSTSHCTRQTIEKGPQGPCRIKQIDVKETARQADNTLQENTEQTVYEYDAMDRISLVAHHYDARLAGQSAAVYTYSENKRYVYDNAGFLTAQSVDSRWVPSDDQPITSRLTYAYTNDRLTQQVNIQTNSYGLQTKTVSTYTYDATGLLTTRTDETTYLSIPATVKEKPAFPDGTTSVWTYQNGKVIDYVVKQGGVDVHPYVFQNGFIQTQGGGNSRSVFTYDIQGHPTKQEFWINGQLTSLVENTYVQAELPPGLTPGNFKGFPTVTNITGVAGVVSSSSYYTLSPAGVLMKTNSSQTQYKLTGAGYVQSSEKATNTYQDEAGTIAQRLTTTTTYTYDGSCD